MMDIVQRLRAREYFDTWNNEFVSKEAADEIERLREDKRMAFKLMSEFLKEINQLRRGLHRIVSMSSDPEFGVPPMTTVQKIAQDALEAE